MKDANLSDKKDILIAGLQERYKAMRIIRERVQGICIWALGIMVAAAGWLAQSDIIIMLERKLLYLLVIGIAFWVLRFKYLKDLERGFSIQQHVAVRLEKALGLYTPGIFDDEKDSIYPKKWEQAGSINSDGSFFSSTYLLLYTGFVILILALLLLRPEYISFFCWL